MSVPPAPQSSGAPSTSSADLAYPVPHTAAEAIAATVSGHRDLVEGIALDLHAHPESAWQEHRSAALLADTLAQHGFEVQRHVADLPTAFLATAGPSDARTRVGIVAEYDALPGLGHACGHNLIAASAVGAALGLAPVLEDLSLQVTVVGAPAEEGGGGKLPLIDAGVFAGLDAAMMVHPGPEDRAWAAPFAVAHFDVTYTGVETHAAAYPWLGVNAADAMTIAQTSIGLLRQHLPDGTRVHGIVTEAGTVPNAVPARSLGKWYVRALGLEQLEEVFTRVTACFEAGALATGCSVEIEETSGRYADFITDERLLATFVDVAKTLGRDLHPEDRSRTGMNTASTDMGNVSHLVPAIHPYLGIDSLPAVNHQREFAEKTIAPAALQACVDGAVALAQTAAALGASAALGGGVPLEGGAALGDGAGCQRNDGQFHRVTRT